MRVVSSAPDLVAELDAARRSGRSVGLVPTMGALHAGHLSLVERAARECDLVVVSVFVNPRQFGAGEDLAAYPRRPEADAAAAESAGASLVFAPRIEDVYPPGFATTVHVAGLSEPLEGTSRPGHFDGVTTVVARLFALAGGCRAYFGEKDFQQLQVVRRLAADLAPRVEVVACATVRDRDGLALSSRNVYLAPEERQAAPVLHRALLAGVALVAAGERDPAVVGAAAAAEVAAEPLASLEYAEVVEALTLRGATEVSSDSRLLVAARIGTTRLIDNCDLFELAELSAPGAGAPSDGAAAR